MKSRSSKSKTVKNPRIPFKQWLESIPGIFGIRLEEEPAFKVLQKSGPFEIRKYSAMVTAQITLHGSHDEAVDEGFSRLAAYIFGENHSRAKFDMTTPVLQKSHKMDMTTPVLQSSTGGEWTISFVLPSKYTLKTAPKPIDSQIRLTRVPSRKVAVYQFSGNPNDANRQRAETELRSRLRGSEYASVAQIIWAQYDQPFTIPFLKRNEAQIEIKAA